STSCWRCSTSRPPQAPETFRARVEGTARTLLAAGVRADRPIVATRLHVSERTLQRRLDDERTSFKATRDAVLREIAEAQPWNPSLTIGDRDERFGGSRCPRWI